MSCMWLNQSMYKNVNTVFEVHGKTIRCFVSNQYNGKCYIFNIKMLNLRMENDFENVSVLNCLDSQLNN